MYFVHLKMKTKQTTFFENCLIKNGFDKYHVINVNTEKMQKKKHILHSLNRLLSLGSCQSNYQHLHF